MLGAETWPILWRLNSHSATFKKYSVNAFRMKKKCLIHFNLAFVITKLVI